MSANIASTDSKYDLGEWQQRREAVAAENQQVQEQYAQQALQAESKNSMRSRHSRQKLLDRVRHLPQIRRLSLPRSPQRSIPT